MVSSQMRQSRKPGIPACRLLIRCGLLAFFICVILYGAVALEVTCQPEWTPSPQSGTCLKVFLKKKTWNEARQDCKNRGGDLVKVLDREMNILMNSDLVKQSEDYSYFYIGLRKLPKSPPIYTWPNETYEANYMSKKLPGLMEKPQSQRCILAQRSYSEKEPDWYDVFCSQANAYICEQIPVKLCPKDWYPNSHAGTCIKVVLQLKSWRKARKHCQSLGGSLAVIVDRRVDQFLSDQTLIIGWIYNKALWIGLSDVGSRGNFKWLDNFVDGVNYSNWGENQPKTPTESNCIKLNQSKKSRSAVWGVTDCEEDLPFICEKFADCEYEKYGMFCPKSCSSTLCADDQAACNKRNGICQNVCSNGRYGVQCLQKCSPHCGGPDKACHILDGTCLSGCEDGFTGDRCETECTKYTYGAKCSEVCSPHCGGQTKTCDHTDGSCHFGCVDGYTGLRCEAACSPHCRGHTNKTCHHRDGSCFYGCAIGYTGLRCDTTCSIHTYGVNCSKACNPHCGGEMKACDHIDGSCLSGCAYGYTGLRCETEDKSKSRLGFEYSTTAIITASAFASTVGLSCFLLWILMKVTDEQLGEDSKAQEEDMSQEEDMAQASHTTQNRWTSQEENMAQETCTSQNRCTSQEENMAQETRTSQKGWTSQEENMAQETRTSQKGWTLQEENMAPRDSHVT